MFHKFTQGKWLHFSLSIQTFILDFHHFLFLCFNRFKLFCHTKKGRKKYIDEIERKPMFHLLWVSGKVFKLRMILKFHKPQSGVGRVESEYGEPWFLMCLRQIKLQQKLRNKRILSRGGTTNHYAIWSLIRHLSKMHVLLCPSRKDLSLITWI